MNQKTNCTEQKCHIMNMLVSITAPSCGAIWQQLLFLSLFTVEQKKHKTNKQSRKCEYTTLTTYCSLFIFRNEHYEGLRT